MGGPFIGGNAWLKPDGTGFSQTCTDANSDGFCDTNFTLVVSNNNNNNNENVDYLPLFVGDTTPPAPVTNLQNTTGNFWINWTWDDPATDYNHTEVWINGTLVEEYNTAGYYNGSYSPHTTKEVTVRPVDASGNKGSFVNQTTAIPNNVPVMSPIADRTVAEGETVFIDADATDVDSDTLTYSCNETNFTDFDPSTGKGNWSTGPGDAGTYYVDFGVSDGYAVDNETVNITIVPSDSVPPASITNLQNTTGSTWINWTWDNPTDTDFSHVMVFIDGSFVTNTSDSFYNATGFSSETSHQISTQTVDASDNVNDTWVNDSATTAPDTTPPGSISDISSFFYNTPDGKEINVYSKSPFYVNWTWDNPPEADFNHTMIYIDNEFKTNTSNNYYLATFQDLDTYKISTRTVDTSGNVNTVWKNDTVTAPTLSESTNVTFDNVTKKGNTEIKSQTTNPVGTSPPGYRFKGEFVDVNTSAEYEGAITVCLDFDNRPGNVEVGDKLFHWDDGNWDDVTTAIDLANNTICGQVTHLSPFAAASTEEEPEPVGGEVAPVNKVKLMMPYIVVSLLAVVAGLGTYTLRKR